MAVEVVESPTGEQRTEHPHIVRRAGTLRGQPVIEGTRIDVRHIAVLYNMGDTVEEILEAHPDITAAQVHDAISYYLDHKTEIDELIEQNKLRSVMRDFDMVYLAKRGLISRARLEAMPMEERGLWYTHETLPAGWE